MLEDSDLKVLTYEPDSKKIFPNTEIKGGIAVTYHEDNGNFGEIGTFTPYQELNGIFHKVDGIEGFESLSSIVVTSYAYHFTVADSFCDRDGYGDILKERGKIAREESAD